jgi:Protein of unknown function (DUF1569)
MNTLANEQSKAEILRRLKNVRPDSPRRWGRMTAPQMICHCSDAYRMAAGSRRVSDATSLVQRTVVKWIALYLPLPWPRGIMTRPEIDQQAGGGTCPGDFAADVAELGGLVESFGAQQIDWPPHPIFGTLSKAEWLRWGYLHIDHHLRQFGA